MRRMKLIHIADTHLGANPHPNNKWHINREKEIWSTMETVIHLAEEKKVDLLLIAGDMFHRQPLLRELKELNYLFSQLTHTKVVFIAGNHDYIKPNSYYHTFEWASQVHCLKSSTCESIYFEDINTEVYGLSYDHYEIKENRYENIQIKDTNRINILLGHGGDEKHIPFSKTQLGSIGFDYVALGHIHIPGVLIPNQMAYAGALEPIDSNDEGPHGYIEAELSKQGNRINFNPLAQREYKTIEIVSNSSFTNRKLLDAIGEAIAQHRRGDIFWKIIIKGYRDEDMEYDLEPIYQLGSVVLVVDSSEPDYDFERIKREYKKSIIGKYIEGVKKEKMNDIEKKALYYGVKAMLDEMG